VHTVRKHTNPNGDGNLKKSGVRAKKGGNTDRSLNRNKTNDSDDRNAKHPLRVSCLSQNQKKRIESAEGGNGSLPMGGG